MFVIKENGKIVAKGFKTREEARDRLKKLKKYAQSWIDMGELAYKEYLKRIERATIEDE